jgi:Initiator Replication protein
VAGAISEVLVDDNQLVKKPPLQLWVNFRQKAMNTAIAEINEKTDLNTSLRSLGRSKHRRVTTLTFSIKTQAIPKGA